MNLSSHRVLIVGAGPVGLALALGLARQGVRSLVLDQSPFVHTEPRATTLWPRTLEILQQWQVLDLLRPHAEALKSLAPFWANDPRPLFDIAVRSLCGPSSQPAAWTLPQAQTEACLRRAVAESGASEIRQGHRLIGFERLNKGVRCAVQPCGGDKAYHVDSEFLVGCDGPHSTVRRQLKLALGGSEGTQNYLYADVRLGKVDSAALSSPRLIDDALGATFAHRIQGNVWRLTGTLASEGMHAPSQVVARCARILPEASVEEVLRADTFFLQDRKSARYVDGRIILAGDAAHLRSWSGSQGLNLGIHDAHNLAWKLGRACDDAKPGDIALLLHAYQSERRGAMSLDLLAGILKISNRMWTRPLLRTRVGRSAVGQTLQVALMQAAGQAWLGAAVGFRGPQYSHSSLILGNHPLVGAPAPNVRVVNDHGVAQHLLDGLLGHALLILFDAGSGAAVLPALRHGLAGIEGVALRRVVPSSQRVGPMCLGDAQGEAYGLWQAKDGMVALVRPDGHIGWVSTLPPTTEEVWTHVRHALGMVPRALPTEGHRSRRVEAVQQQVSA